MTDRFKQRAEEFLRRIYSANVRGVLADIGRHCQKLHKFKVIQIALLYRYVASAARIPVGFTATLRACGVGCHGAAHAICLGHLA